MEAVRQGDMVHLMALLRDQHYGIDFAETGGNRAIVSLGSSMVLVANGRNLRAPEGNVGSGLPLTKDKYLCFTSTQSIRSQLCSLHTGLGEPSSHAASGLFTGLPTPCFISKARNPAGYLFLADKNPSYGEPILLLSRNGYLTASTQGNVTLHTEPITRWVILPATTLYTCMRGGYCQEHGSNPELYLQGLSGERRVYRRITECLHDCEEDKS